MILVSLPFLVELPLNIINNNNNNNNNNKYFCVCGEKTSEL